MLTRHRNSQSASCHAPLALTLTALVAAVALSAFQAGIGTAQDATEPVNSASNVPTRAQLKEKQLDVSLEARDIERVLGKLKRASELSKQRITEAAQVAESATGAIDRGDSQGARSNAQQAAEMFQEIARQLEALLAEETPQRVAAAQKLAQQLSRAERQFLQQFPGALNPQQNGGRGKIDPRSQIRPEANPNQKQGGGGQPNPKQGKSGETPKAESNGEAKKPAEDRNGTAGDKQDMPPEGSKKNGDTAKGGNNQKQDGTGGSQDKSEGTNDLSSKQKNLPPDGRGSDAEKNDAQDSSEGVGGMTDEERREALARRAEQLAESGRTLEDVLKAISQSTDPADADAARKVEAVLQETHLSEAIAKMQQAAGAIRSGNLEDVRLESLDLADRLEIASQRLGSAYRLIVAPRAEELRDVEKALAVLRDKLDQLETPSQVAAWHREVSQLLSKLEELAVSDEMREQLLEEMKKATGGGLVAWEVINGHYVAPSAYTSALIHLQEQVQARLQDLLLGDFDSSPDEALSPKYQELVERYYQVLSRDSGRRKQGTPTAPVVPSPKN